MSPAMRRDDADPRAFYVRLLSQVQRQRRLLTIHWELTQRCNEHCTHCYLDVLPPHARPTDELTTATCLAVIEQAAELGVLYLTFSGGEALLRRDFFEIAGAAHARRFVMRIFTNGLAITSVVARRLAAVHPYAVEISVYGSDAATHEGITRRPGSFVRTKRAFELLAAEGVRTVLKTPLMRENVGQFEALAGLAAALGASFRYDPTITATRAGERRPLAHALEYRELVALYGRQIPRIAGKDTGTNRGDRLGARCDSSEPAGAGCRTCGVGSSALVIGANGDVFPCMELPWLAGNVRSTSLRAIWEDAPVWGRVRTLHAAEKVQCGRCPLGSLCTRCHGAALHEHGDVCAASTMHCVQALARRQVLIDEDEAAVARLPLTDALAALHEQVVRSCGEDSPRGVRIG